MYGGFWDTLQDTFGISAGTAAAVARAEVEPSITNINAVSAAFAVEGTSPPPEIMDLLWQRYYESVKSNPYAAGGTVTSAMSNPLLWAAGAAALYFLLRRR
jgi:hypothetical protein